MPWYDVWDLEKEYAIDPNINLPDRSERAEVDSNALRIHDSTAPRPHGVVTYLGNKHCCFKKYLPKRFRIG